MSNLKKELSRSNREDGKICGITTNVIKIVVNNDCEDLSLSSKVNPNH